MKDNQPTQVANPAGRHVFDIMRGHVISTVFASLEMNGVLADLAAKGLRAGDVGENHFLTEATLRYLAQRGVVRTDGDVYRLTDFGKELYEERGYLVWLSGGYGEALHRFGDLLSGRRRFRTDIDRDVRWVAVGSALVGQKDLVPEVMEVLREIEFDRVADLGCGNGHFLIGVCRAVGGEGIGVDISRDACAEARQEVARAGLDDRITIVQADARDPGNIAGLDGVQLVVTFFFLHEVLEAGHDVLVDYLGQLAGRLPSRAYLLTAEITPPEREHNAPELLSPEYVLTQAFMTQDLLGEEGWRQAFTESGFQVRRVVRPNLPGARIILAQKAS
jgi:SAM-dependent methyltransferase